MKKILTLTLFVLLVGVLSAQVLLDVCGDAKIQGKLDLRNSTTDGSIFIGINAGLNDDGTNNENVFIGRQAGILNTTGSSNIFLGSFAGSDNTTGFFNTFLGTIAGNLNTTGNSNTFIGRAAGSDNTTGDFNTFIGMDAGRANTTGNSNTFLGEDAGHDNTTGRLNTFIGESAGHKNTTGAFNTFVGEGAGFLNTTGSFLEAFGYDATASFASTENAFVMGSNGLITSSHSGVLGNVSAQKIVSYVNVSTASDGRMKKNIKEDVQGLAFIKQLRPISYQVDALKLDRFLRKGMNTNKTTAKKEKATAEERKAAADNIKIYDGYLRAKSKIKYTGFIAQEVEEAAKEVGFEFSGVVPPSHDKDHYSLRYAEFVVPLVKAVQEQQEIIEEQENVNNQQQEIIEEQKNVNNQQQELIENLTSQVAELSSLVEQLIATPSSAIQEQELLLKTKAQLEQNQPNPFHQNTVVQYFIPIIQQQAFLQVTAADGKVLGRVPISQSGQGQVTIKANSYPAGTYFYSLIVDGQILETKRMVLTER